MAVSGAIYFNGAIAVLVGGIYWKPASSAGAFAALLAGFTAILGLGPVQQKVGLQTWNESSGEWIQKLSGAQGRDSFRCSRLCCDGCFFPFNSRPISRPRSKEIIMTWILFWKIVFIFVVIAFALMAVLTTILGAKDIRSLFRHLQSDEKNEEE